MVKKLNNVKWETVSLEGFPVSMSENFEGFVGLEECTNYGLDKENKISKKRIKKRKNTESVTKKEIPNKKVKLSNGFIVENCNIVAPSLTNEVSKESKKKKNSKTTEPLEINTELLNDKESVNFNKKNKPKLGEDISEKVKKLTLEDMVSWSEYRFPEGILKGLADLGFQNPTKIQQLTLPAAIHGRRDILGAAETGSGKTLAFGLPILFGIMSLKEKAAAKDLDVYDIPYKKSSAKKKNVQSPENKRITKKRNTKKNKKKVKQVKVKESSEDSYSSGDSKEEDNDETKEEEYLEEIEVPLRKKEISADEGNDSDESDNYVHLSEMLDSDDLTETDEESDDESGHVDGNSDGSIDVMSGEETDSQDEVDENRDGMGCVKVVDDVEFPRAVVTKTGKPLYALILTPTRELAIQISRHLIAAAKYTGIRVATIVGGMAAVKQERVLRSGPEIVVATPGRLWELISQGQPHLQQLDCVKFLAIDETDRMIERGHFEELHPLLERLNADDDRRSTRQNFVFSATLTMVHDLPAHMKGKKVTKHGKIINRKIEKMTPQQKIKKLIDMIGMTDPKVVDITTKNLGTAETLTECRIACSLEHKDAYLYYILKRHPGRTIVFCNSIGSVKRLAQLFTLLKCRPLPLHASMPQRQRLKNLERFRDDPHGVLVATDVAARGLDIPDVDHVLHYQVPRTAENYVHRSGRTARANKEGLTILMMEPSEAYSYAKICKTLNKTLELPTFPVPPQILNPMKELMFVARDLDALMLKKRRALQSQGWLEKAAKEMDMIVDEDDVPVKKVDPSIDKALQIKKRQLETMLSRPIFPKGFSFKYPTLNDPDALTWKDEKALQVMKKAIESGELKKEKRKTKNASLISLAKNFK